MPSSVLSDTSIRFPPDLLADAVRTLLDASPSDQSPSAVGQLKIGRAWLPVFPLDATEDTVLTVVCGDDSGERIGRDFTTQEEIDVGFSVQKKLRHDPQGDLGVSEIREVANFAERCLRAAFTRVVDEQGQAYAAQRYQRVIVDETLANWNQISIVFSITYKAVR